MDESATVDSGQVRDTGGAFDRKGLCFGPCHDWGAGLTAKGRVGVIQDRGLHAGLPADADTVLISAAATCKIDDARCLLFTLEAADARSDGTSMPDGADARVSLAMPSVRPTMTR